MFFSVFQWFFQWNDELQFAYALHTCFSETDKTGEAGFGGFSVNSIRWLSGHKRKKPGEPLWYPAGLPWLTGTPGHAESAAGWVGGWWGSQCITPGYYPAGYCPGVPTTTAFPCFPCFSVFSGDFTRNNRKIPEITRKDAKMTQNTRKWLKNDWISVKMTPNDWKKHWKWLNFSEKMTPNTVKMTRNDWISVKMTPNTRKYSLFFSDFQ